MNYLLIYLKFIDQIIENRDKRRDSMQKVLVLCPKSSTSTVNAPFGLGLWRLHTLAVQVERLWEFMAKGLDFALGLWRLHTMPN